MGAWASDCPATWWEQVEIGGLLNESLEVINNLFPGRPAHCLTGAMVGLIWGTTNTRVESTNTSEKEPLRFTWYQFIYDFSILGLLFHVCGEAVVNVSANRRDRQVGSSLVVQSFCWLPCPWLLLVGLVAWFSLTVVGWICCLLFFGLH